MTSICRWLAMAACLGAVPAEAAPVTIANPGFEAQVHGPNTFTFGAPTGWSAYNTGAVAGETIGTLNPNATTYFTPGQWGGSNVGIAYIDAGGTAGVEFGLRQTLSETLQADTLYTLTVEVGNIASGSSDLGGGPIFFDLSGFPGYRIELLAGGTLLAADVNSLSIAEGAFETSQIAFDSTGIDPLLIGQALTIGLVNLNLPDAGAPTAHREVDFDDVRLDASAIAIPAPPALPLFAVAILGLATLRRRGADG